MGYAFSFPYILRAGPDLLSGLAMTLQVSIVSMVLACVIGVVGAALRVLEAPIAARLVGGYVTFIRSTPLLPQNLLHLLWPCLARPAAVGLLVGGACIVAVGRRLQHRERARRFPGGPAGLARCRNRIGPAADRLSAACRSPHRAAVSIPAILNTSISVLKNSAYLQAIGLAELTFVAMERVAQDLRTLEMFAAIGVLYLALVLVLSLLVRRIEIGLARPFRTG